MKNGTFQIVLVGAFAFLAVAGIAIFSTYRGGDKDNLLKPATIWGTIPASVFDDFEDDAINRDLKLTYRFIRPEVFNETFIEALASGKGPDLIIGPHELILKHRSKLYVTPYELITGRSFRDTYIQSAEVFLTTGGVLALPIAIDPLVMYWNREHLSAAGIASPPKTWEELPALVKTLAVKDTAGTVSKAAVALGEYKNIDFAKALLSTLMIQAGNEIVEYTSKGMESILNNSSTRKAAAEALLFYTNFANPRSNQYTWNRALPTSKKMFQSENLTFYFGLASELNDIRKKNPNIDFDVASVPFLASTKSVFVTGKVYAVATVKNTRNVGNSIAVEKLLANDLSGQAWAKSLGLAPARRNLLAKKQTDPYKAISFDAAVKSKAWFDPDYAKTDLIFAKMIELVTSGRSSAVEAISGAHSELNALLEKK